MSTNQNSISVQGIEVSPFKKSSGEKKYLKAMKKVFKSKGSPRPIFIIKATF